MDLDAQWQYCNRSTLGRLFLMEHSDFLHRPSEEVTSCPTRSLWSTPPGPLVAMDHWHHVSYHGSRMFGDCVALCSKNKRPISGLDRLAHCSGTRQRFFWFICVHQRCSPFDGDFLILGMLRDYGGILRTLDWQNCY